MTLTMLYAILVIGLTFACAANCRRAKTRAQLYVCLGITAAYVAVCLVLWLMVLDATGDRSIVWLVTLGVLLVAAVAVGLTARTSGEVVSRSIFWSKAAGLRRTYRNLVRVEQ
ncbi:MAG: hypothetical protein ACOYD4_06790 [Solirubrobacterales bacterium]